MLKAPAKDQKDVKSLQLSRSVSKTGVLSSGMQGLRIATAQSSLNSGSAKMVDEPSPTSPPSPPPSPKSAINKAIAGLRIPLSKIPPDDKDAVEAARKTVTFLAGLGDNSARDLKHFYAVFNNFFLLGGVSVGGAANPMDAGKSCASSLAGFVGGTNPGFTLNEQILAGNAINFRIGRDIVLQHLTWRMNCNWTQQIANASISQYTEYMIPFRMIIFEDLQPFAANPTNCTSGLTGFSDGTSVYLNPTGAGTAWLGNVAPWNPNTHGTRYRILHNEVFNPPANATAFGVAGTTNWAAAAQDLRMGHVDVKGIKCRFVDDSTGGPSLLIKGNIYIMWSIDTTVAGIQPNIDFMYDLSFIDG